MPVPSDEEILRVLSECGGNRSKAARILGINRSTVIDRALNHDLDPPLQTEAVNLDRLHGDGRPEIESVRQQILRNLQESQRLARLTGLLPNAGETVHQQPNKSLDDEFPNEIHPRIVPTEVVSTTVFISDIHFPFHDKRLLPRVYEAISDIGPDRVIIGGDLFDCYSISRFDKTPGRSDRIQDEFDLARDNLGPLAENRGMEVIFVQGNHDARVQEITRQNIGLSGLRVMDLRTAAELPEHWIVHPHQTHLRIGKMTILHGDLRGSTGGKHVAHNLYHRIKTSCLFGHYHRPQAYFEPGIDHQPRGSWSCGHLSDVRMAAEYYTYPQWGHGFAVIEMDRSDGLFRVDLIVADDRGRFRLRGKSYGAASSGSQGLAQPDS